MLRRGTLAGIAVCAVVLAVSAPTSARGSQGRASSLQADLARALAAPGVDPMRTGALAVDLRTGRVVFQRNPSLALAPASAEKLPVAFAALQTLGPSFRFHTEVRGAGQLVGTEWRGDLYLVGHGDPTLGARGHRSARTRREGGGHSSRDWKHDRRRALLRHASNSTGLEAVVPRDRVPRSRHWWSTVPRPVARTRRRQPLRPRSRPRSRDAESQSAGRHEPVRRPRTLSPLPSITRRSSRPSCCT